MSYRHSRSNTPDYVLRLSAVPAHFLRDHFSSVPLARSNASVLGVIIATDGGQRNNMLRQVLRHTGAVGVDLAPRTSPVHMR